MDHLAILRRMWKMLWSYRALWIFGLILALTTSSGNGSANSGAQFSRGSGGGQGIGAESLGQLLPQLGRAFRGAGQFFDRSDLSLLVGSMGVFLVALCGLGLLLTLIGLAARFVAETAVIRMVDDHEATGDKKTIGQGFRLGWSRAALRLFLISLVVALPIGVAAVLLFALALLPLLAWVTEITVLGVFGTVLTIGLAFLVLLAVIVVSLLAHLWLRLAWRAAALEDLGVGAALRRGWGLIRNQFQDVGLMWLIMVGIRLGYGVLMIPVVVILSIIAGVAGITILLLVRGVSGLFATGILVWVVGALLAAPIFILILAVPMLILTGLYKVYESGVWTLTFRELTATADPLSV
jgi:hypothetical protein